MRPKFGESKRKKPSRNLISTDLRTRSHRGKLIDVPSNSKRAELLFDAIERKKLEYLIDLERQYMQKGKIEITYAREAIVLRDQIVESYNLLLSKYKRKLEQLRTKETKEESHVMETRVLNFLNLALKRLEKMENQLTARILIKKFNTGAKPLRHNITNFIDQINTARKKSKKVRDVTESSDIKKQSKLMRNLSNHTGDYTLSGNEAQGLLSELGFKVRRSGGSTGKTVWTKDGSPSIVLSVSVFGNKSISDRNLKKRILAEIKKSLFT